MKKILVIEDEPSVRANILEILELEDYHGIGAENGLIGVLWALEHIPDLIICDVMMPELDGYGVLTTLRQDPLTATIPFILLTAKADKADFRQGMELGADDYLTKPFTSDELLNSIATRFEKQVAVMQQYSIEREGVAGLQQKMQELQQDADTKDELLKNSQEELRYLLSKINVALHMLGYPLKPGQQVNSAMRARVGFLAILGRGNSPICSTMYSNKSGNCLLNRR
jgi:CheY-like chemotaxis protein